jgi:hypothetical protein
MSATAVEVGGLPNDGTTFAVTATGPIGLAPSFISTAPPDIAWLGLQELHRRSLGLAGDDSFFSPEAVAMTPEQAFGAYSSGVIGVLGQLAVTGSAAGDRLLGSLTDYAELQGSLDGLEAPFLTAFASASRDRFSPSLDPAAELWNELGLPDQLGGGAQTTPIVNPATGQVVFADADKMMSTFGSASSPSAPGSPPTMSPSAAFSGVVGSLFHPGPSTTAGGRPSPFSGPDAKTVCEGLLAWGAMTVAGGAAGPLGAVAGFIGGLFTFLVTLGGTGDAPAAVRHPATGQSQGQQAADGKCVTVAQTEVTTKQGGSVMVDKDGNTHLSGPGTVTTTTTTSGDKKCLEPNSPSKCWRDDDGNLNPEFVVPFWQNSVVMSPTLLPVGPGLDALVVGVGDGLAQLTALPSIDAAGAVEAVGFLSSAFVPASSRTGRVVLR